MGEDWVVGKKNQVDRATPESRDQAEHCQLPATLADLSANCVLGASQRFCPPVNWREHAGPVPKGESTPRVGKVRDLSYPRLG